MPIAQPKHILFVIDKTFTSRALHEAIQRLNAWPGSLVTFLSTEMLGLYHFQHPQHPSMKDFPWTGEVLLRPRHEHRKFWPVLSGICGGDADDARISISEADARSFHSCKDLVLNSGLGEGLSKATTLSAMLDELLNRADLIVKATEGYRGELTFRDILTLGKTREVPPEVLDKTRVLTLLRMSDAGMDGYIRELLAEGSPWNPFNRQMLYGEAKEFMDWHWAVNAPAVFSRALENAGLPLFIKQGKRNISFASLLGKFSIVLAHALEREAIPSDTNQSLMDGMADWNGTGRYPNRKMVDSKAMGSFVSRRQILDNLLKIGILDNREDVHYGLAWKTNLLDVFVRNPVFREGYDLGLSRRVKEYLDITEKGELPLSPRQLVENSSRLMVDDHGFVQYRMPLAVSVMNAGNSETREDYDLAGFIEQVRVYLNKRGRVDKALSPQEMVEMSLIFSYRQGARLTDAGRKFLDQLGKDSYDPDLPGRLDMWCRAWPASKPAMLAYIWRWFGSVDRSLGMASLLENDNAQANALLLVNALGVDSAAKAAQVGDEVIRKALDGHEISPGQARAIGLAAQRLASESTLSWNTYCDNGLSGHR